MTEASPAGASLSGFSLGAATGAGGSPSHPTSAPLCPQAGLSAAANEGSFLPDLRALVLAEVSPSRSLSSQAAGPLSSALFLPHLHGPEHSSL